MAGVFDSDIAVAKQLIAEYGQTCYWQKPAPVVTAVPGYPTAGDLPDPVECTIAFFSAKDLGFSRNLGDGYHRGQNEAMPDIPANAEIGLMVGDVDFEPASNDTVRRGSPTAERLPIVSIDRLAPNGTPVLYYVMLKQ